MCVCAWIDIYDDENNGDKEAPATSAPSDANDRNTDVEEDDAIEDEDAGKPASAPISTSTMVQQVESKKSTVATDDVEYYDDADDDDNEGNNSPKEPSSSPSTSEIRSQLNIVHSLAMVLTAY
jgi:hypothetical protein